MLSIFLHYIITVLFEIEWVVSKVVCPLKKVLKLSNFEFFSNLEKRKNTFLLIMSVVVYKDLLKFKGNFTVLNLMNIFILLSISLHIHMIIAEERVFVAFGK